MHKQTSEQYESVVILAVLLYSSDKIFAHAPVCPFKLEQILIQFLCFFYRLEHTQPNSAYPCPNSSFFSNLQAKRKE